MLWNTHTHPAWFPRRASAREAAMVGQPKWSSGWKIPGYKDKQRTSAAHSNLPSTTFLSSVKLMECRILTTVFKSFVPESQKQQRKFRKWNLIFPAAQPQTPLAISSLSLPVPQQILSAQPSQHTQGPETLCLLFKFPSQSSYTQPHLPETHQQATGSCQIAISSSTVAFCPSE